ncbi:hypothetical protein DB345_20935 [Spartobacteria bacterium LR76]|nr:hypothetical protein DB345_20935 [Spartobacteria bacterium LR76]
MAAPPILKVILSNVTALDPLKKDWATFRSDTGVIEVSHLQPRALFTAVFSVEAKTFSVGALSVVLTALTPLRDTTTAAGEMQVETVNPIKSRGNIFINAT